MRVKTCGEVKKSSRLWLLSCKNMEEHTGHQSQIRHRHSLSQTEVSLSIGFLDDINELKALVK